MIMTVTMKIMIMIIIIVIITEITVIQMIIIQVTFMKRSRIFRSRKLVKSMLKIRRMYTWGT